jgi:sortase A
VRRLLTGSGVVLLVVGLTTVAWGAWTWRYGDPLTAFYTKRAQAELADELDRKRAAFQVPRPVPATATTTAAPLPTRATALGYRETLGPGDAVGRLAVPRLGLDVVVVYGTGSDALRRGPGIHEQTGIPGQGRLIYVAGHRTTFGAPFAHIDRLRPGDSAIIDMPYGRYVYRVTRHRIVDDNDLSVLRSTGRELLSLQACHPRFRASQRYIVSARLERVTAAPA